MAMDALRYDGENQASARRGKRIPRTTALRNSIGTRFLAHLETDVVQPPGRRSSGPEYRARSRRDDTAGGQRAFRQVFPVIKGSFTKRQKACPDVYRPHTTANNVARLGICLRPPKPFGRKGAFDTLTRLPVYRRRQSILFRAPASLENVVEGAEREQAEFAWLCLNRQEYAGRWVALDGGALLAVGNSAREVFAATANHRGTPLVTRVEPEGEPYFAGW